MVEASYREKPTGVNPNILFEQGTCRISVEDTIRPGAVDLLGSIVYGTNGPLFQHVDAPEKVKHIIRPLTFTLEQQRKTIGTCTFLERNLIMDGKTYKAWYSRYFAITPERQGTVFGNLLLKTVKSFFEKAPNTPTVYYGYVDDTNTRSKRLLTHTGLESIRTFQTLAFSRVNPKKNRRVHRITEKDKPTVLSALNEQYKNYTFVNFDPLFIHNNYFVLKNNGEIVAGIRANITKWKICHLPGLSGKILMRVVPFIPFLSRIFNPRDFRFLGFEGIYCKSGYEKELFILMESICAELKFHSGITWIDPESELYNRIKDAGDWGIMNQLKREVPAKVFAAFQNVTEEEKNIFKERPAYISAFDLT